MLQLVCYFLYMGIQLSFWSGVYGPSLANTLDFDDPKALTGLHGILIGVGEIVAGLVFGVFGHVTNKYGRYPVVVLGSVLQLTSIILIVLNIPKDAVFGETTELPILGSSSEAIALACSVMLGFGDACYNTQTMSLLAGVYPDRAGPAFAIFKFVQCVAAAAGFFYSGEIDLFIQGGISGGLMVVGTIFFVKIDIQTRRKAAKSESTMKLDTDNVQIEGIRQIEE